jgi:hypothetical protein
MELVTCEFIRYLLIISKVKLTSSNGARYLEQNRICGDLSGGEKKRFIEWVGLNYSI